MIERLAGLPSLSTKSTTMSQSQEDDPQGSINLDSLSLDQLDRIKQQEENRLQSLTARFSQLRSAAARLNVAQMAVSEFSPALEGKQVMVPLTPSLYVPGKIKDPNKLLVELGTGYFVEKAVKDTSQFLGRKLKIVDANSENVTKVIQVTQQNLESVSMAMQGKMLEIRARQEGVQQQAMDSS